MDLAGPEALPADVLIIALGGSQFYRGLNDVKRNTKKT